MKNTHKKIREINLVFHLISRVLPGTLPALSSVPPTNTPLNTSATSESSDITPKMQLRIRSIPELNYLGSDFYQKGVLFPEYDPGSISNSPASSKASPIFANTSSNTSMITEYNSDIPPKKINFEESKESNQIEEDSDSISNNSLLSDYVAFRDRQSKIMARSKFSVTKDGAPMLDYRCNIHKKSYLSDTGLRNHMKKEHHDDRAVGHNHDVNKFHFHGNFFFVSIFHFTIFFPFFYFSPLLMTKTMMKMNLD